VKSVQWLLKHRVVYKMNALLANIRMLFAQVLKGMEIQLSASMDTCMYIL